MKIKASVPHIFAALALLLLLSLTASLPVQAIDLSSACSLTVRPGSDEFSEDLAQAGLVIDLYQIGTVEAIAGVDGYMFQLLPDYTALSMLDDMTNDDWHRLAQEAAAIALAGQMPCVTGAQPDSVITETDEGPLGAGLYLIIAHGADETDYVTTITDDEGMEKLVTTAHTDVYTYTFQPELVVLPGKEVDASGEMNTASDGQWLYDMTVTLKPEQDRRLGSVSIVKTLRSYNAASGPVTFVFQVDGTIEGQPVYSDVFSLTFTAPGEQSILVENIPAGAEVTVTEVYSGAGYRLVSDATQTAIIQADAVAAVSFENDYDGGQKNGYGITNYFVFQPGAGWDWQQLTDNGSAQGG
jgi:hypothetical protein